MKQYRRAHIAEKKRNTDTMEHQYLHVRMSWLMICRQMQPTNNSEAFLGAENVKSSEGSERSAKVLDFARG